MQNKSVKGLVKLLHIHRLMLLKLSQSRGSPRVSVKYLPLCNQHALCRVLCPFPFGEEGRTRGRSKGRGCVLLPEVGGDYTGYSLGGNSSSDMMMICGLFEYSFLIALKKNKNEGLLLSASNDNCIMMGLAGATVRHI